MYCKHCGKEIVNDSVFCSYCGSVQTGHKKQTSDTVGNVILLVGFITVLAGIFRPDTVMSDRIITVLLGLIICTAKVSFVRSSFIFLISFGAALASLGLIVDDTGSFDFAGLVTVLFLAFVAFYYFVKARNQIRAAYGSFVSLGDIINWVRSFIKVNSNKYEPQPFSPEESYSDPVRTESATALSQEQSSRPFPAESFPNHESILRSETIESDLPTGKTENAICPPVINAIDIHWEDEIKREDVMSFITKKPYYDCETKRCTDEIYEDYRNRFVNLNRFIVLDIETTGLNPKEDRIIEITAVKFEKLKTVGTFSTLLNPRKTLPARITALTGITQKDVSQAPLWKDVESDFEDFIGDWPLVGHNINGFDVRFIERSTGIIIDNPLVDTLDYSRCMYPDLPSHKLSDMKIAFGFHVDRSHRTLDDVKATFLLLITCLTRDCDIPSTSLNAHSQKTDCSPVTYTPPKDRRKKHKHSKNAELKDIYPTCEYIDPGSALYGKIIVFTGTLSISRKEAMQMAVNAGAELRTQVSGKTDYLVVGEQDLLVVGDDGISTKEEKARTLNSSGKANVKIIGENEFFKLVKNE